MKDLLKKITDVPKVSGSEDDIRNIIVNEIKEYVDTIEIDKFGNIISIIKGDKKPKVMLAAHMDEIGLMVKFIDEKGFIRFIPIGGINDQMLLNQRVTIKTSKGYIPGVIGSRPPHLMDEEEKKKLITYDKMYIDVGAKNYDDVLKMGIQKGDSIFFTRIFTELANNNISAMSLDNSVGCTILISLIKNLKKVPAELYTVFTTQEEVGLKGATVCSYSINPDVALAVDIEIAGDYPEIKKEEADSEIGKGTSFVMSDALGRGLIIHPQVKKWLLDTAKDLNIPYQLHVGGKGGTTDASSIRLAREGIPTGAVSVPIRYAHTPIEVVNLIDMENTMTFLKFAIEKVNKYFPPVQLEIKG
ncbi:MAG: M42 family metallopeptidase [bacterium]